MPMMSKTPGKEPQARSTREIEEIIGTIEQYLQQTREVLDRIDKEITEMKKESRIQREKDEILHPKKAPAEVMGRKI